MYPFNLLLTSLCLTRASAQNTGLLVKTQQGEVLGSHITPTVRQFLGIPYAAANRWEAPRIPTPRPSGPLDATKFGDSCFQANNPPNVEFLRLTGGALTNVTESENCLSVNIWAPSTDRKQDTAVMVWIYGGGFTIGTVRHSY